MKYIIDLPEKTVAHIRSDYGHGIKNISFEEDRKLITEEIINSITLCKELEEIKTDIHLSTVTGITGKTLVRVELVDEILDNHISELKGENNVL